MNALRLGLTRGCCFLTFPLLAQCASGAILTVTNLASLGPGTLRQALSDNQSLGGGNTVVFAGNLSGTITLAGVLSVNSPVTILGPGTNVIAVSRNDSVQVFAVAAGPAPGPTREPRRCLAGPSP